MATSVARAVGKTLSQISKLQCLRCHNITSRYNNLQVLSLRCTTYQKSSLHTSPRQSDLMEFFDAKDNWGEENVKVGRPWKKDELRLKGNTDLHKLWYVLLKERNMLMTMEEEYKRQNSLFPSPERIEKVEESMENLLEVVAERDRAYHMAEQGVTGEPGERVTYDILGREFVRRNKEHYEPMEVTGRKERRYQWQERYLTLQREKDRRREDGYRIRSEKRAEEMKRLFPDADLD